MDEIKPCPFCGRKVEVVKRGDFETSTKEKYFLSCFNGGNVTHAWAWGETLAKVTAMWNQRAGWIECTSSLPALGQSIVCEYKTGNVWAGRYLGEKQTFLRWMPLPTQEKS